MTRVKICGLMNQNDIEMCVGAGVHMLGFIADYPEPVPWNLSINQAAELVDKVPPFTATCLVTGGAVRKVIETAAAIRPDFLQLHYSETLAEVREIAQAVITFGVKTIKALRINSTGQCDFDESDPVEAVKRLGDSGVSAILADSYSETLPGGTGSMIDLETYRIMREATHLPVILAGGLKPSNVLKIIEEVYPFAIDVLTGVENQPGRKDVAKIEELMRSCR